MLCTKPDIAHTMIFFSRYMSILGKENWATINRFFYGRGAIRRLHGRSYPPCQLGLKGFVTRPKGPHGEKNH